MIFLRPRNGICNRLRVMSSGLALARESNCKLCVYWVDDDGLNEKFTNLFSVPSGFELVEKKSKALEELFSAANPMHLGKDEFSNQQRVSSFLNDVRARAKDVDFSISSSSHFCGNHDYAWVKLTDQLEQKCRECEQLFGGNCIGVHIRRTDNVKSRAYSPLSLFVEAIQREIAGDSHVRVFLATDSNDDRQVLLKMFGDRIITRSGIAARFERNGIIDGVVDLMLLSRTKKIYGSYWSSFSEGAAYIGKIPRVSLKMDLGNPEAVIADLNDKICQLTLQLQREHSEKKVDSLLNRLIPWSKRCGSDAIRN